jgi:DNA-binding response OmpR family regulator
MKILVVEDEPALLDMIDEYLTDIMAHEVVNAVNGIDAYEAFTVSPDTFDLVISDITLPGLDGVGLAKKIRKISDVPIILTTGHTDFEREANMLEIKIFAVLIKPFMLNELDAVVTSVQN